MTAGKGGNEKLDKPVGLFDGSCRFCVTTTEQLRRLDREEKIEWLDLHDPNVRLRFPLIDWERAEEEIHLIHPEGRVVTGVRAIHDVMQYIGGDAGTAAARVMELPGVNEAADVLYHIISENRFRIFGETKK